MSGLLPASAQPVLERYRVRAARESAIMAAGGPAMAARRDEFLLPIGEEVGAALAALIVARGAGTIVEIGTSYGFSTLFLAAAAACTGGMVHTIELASDKQAYAREQIAEAGLSAHVEWYVGDAGARIADLPDGIDFALIDLWKELYVPCLETLYPKLAPGGIVAADNILFPEAHRADARAYRERVRAFPDLESILLPIGAGIELSVRAGPKP